MPDYICHLKASFPDTAGKSRAALVPASSPKKSYSWNMWFPQTVFRYLSHADWESTWVTSD